MNFMKCMSKNTMKYSIVIPTYNHCNDLLKPCVDSLLKYTDMNNIELIISANGCFDETNSYLNELKKLFIDAGIGDNLLIHWSDEATGYSKATNDGIKLSTSDKIILLNNDVILLEQSKNYWIKKLAYQFEIDKKCGISGPLKVFCTPAGRFFLVFFCVMIDRKVFDTIGLLNEEYGKGGYEDTEMCILAENNGFNVNKCVQEEFSMDNLIYFGDFPVYHKGEGTVHDKNLVPDWSEIFEKNTLLIAKKFNTEWYKWALSNNFELEKKKEILLNPIQDLNWLKGQHEEIFNEIVVDNCYDITPRILNNKNVLDIGANNGIFSILSAYYNAKKIISIEPISSTYALLTQNIKKYSNIEAIKKVVTDKTGEFINISINENNGHNSQYNILEKFETIESITLHDLLEKFDDDPIYLKLDCEGAEYDIILSASQEDMKRIDTIALEIHGELHPHYKGFDILHEKLNEFGFNLLNKKQVFYYESTYTGEIINQRPLPFVIEIWSKIK